MKDNTGSLFSFQNNSDVCCMAYGEDVKPLFLQSKNLPQPVNNTLCCPGNGIYRKECKLEVDGRSRWRG